MNRIQLLLSTSLLAYGLAAQPALAFEATAAEPATTAGPIVRDGQKIEDIIVTAERRFNTAQRTAASISVRSGEDMLQQGRYELKNILEDVPGVVGGAANNVNTSQGSGTDNPAAGLTIRGLQSNSGVGGSITSTAAAAAIYVDDVYNGIGGSYDIDRVEILRGPQGTLYGRSATAGVVAIHTRDPNTKAFGLQGSGELGNYNLYHFTGDVNVPLVADKLAIRVSGNHFERDGYYATEGDARSSTEFRAKLLWTPTSNFSALLGYAQQFNTTNSGGLSISQGRSPTDFIYTKSELSPPGKNHFRQYWANLNLDLGPVAITYIPAYRTWFQDALLYGRGPGFSINNSVRTPVDSFMTHELRIHSTDNDSKLRWQAGFLYYRNNLRDEVTLFNNLLGFSLFKSKTHKVTTAAGVFAEGTYSFTPDTRLTAGIRYDRTKIVVDQDYTGFTGITKSLTGDDRLASFNNITYKARLEHDLTPQNLVYASISTGFSPGDTSITQNIFGQPLTERLKAETLTAYEVGTKNRFLDNHLQVNGAAFYYDYAGYQNSGINTSTIFGIRTFRTISAPMKSYGAELEIQARPWADGTISLEGSYTHARYGDFGADSIYFSTNKVAPVPEFQGSAAYDHRVRIGSAMLMLRGDVRYASAHNSSRITQRQAALGATPYIHVPSAVLADANASLILNSNFTITGYVRNIGDKRILPDNWNIADVFPSPIPGGPPIILSDSRTLSEPRTFGVIFTVKY